MIFLLLSVSMVLWIFVSSIEHDINSHQLKLSVRDFHFATSCEYTIGQMEVLNLHTTEPVTITSIRTQHEIHEPYDEESFIDQGEGDLLGDITASSTEISECPELPDQFTVPSKVDLTMEPGQMLIFPISIFPRFPPPIMEELALSYFASADYHAIYNYVRSNRYETFYQQQQQLTSTTVELDTSRGKVEMPLEVISQATNRYGLIPTIYFERYIDDHTVDATDDPIEQAVRQIQASKQKSLEETIDDTIPTPTSTAPRLPRIQHSVEAPTADDIIADIRSQHDCYDLYVKGLPHRSYEIDSVRLVMSKDHNLRLYIAPGHTEPKGRRRLVPTAQGILQMNHWDIENESSSLIFPHDGSFTVPMASDDMDHDDDPRHYVVTVCRMSSSEINTDDDTNPSEFDAEMEDWIPPPESPMSLGFVVVRTSEGPLAVPLEQQSLSKATAPVITPEHRQKKPSSFLESEALNITFFQTAMPHAILDVPVTVHRANVKLMRASVSLQWPELSSYDEDDVQGIALQLQDVVWTPLNVGNQNIANLSVQMDWQILQEHLPNTTTWVLRGALILHLTPDPDLTYSQWLDRLHPKLYDTDHIVEIPLEIHLCRSSHVVLAVQQTSHHVSTFWNLRLYNGVMTIADAAFFPAYPEITKTAVPRSLYHKVEDAYTVGADHRMRVFTNAMDGIQVQQVGIREETRNDDGNKATDSFSCNKLFIANIMKDSTIHRKKIHPYFNVGVILIHYRFPRTTIALDTLPIQPRVCTLTFETLPRTGPHEFPLLVYSGRLAVDTQDPPRFNEGIHPSDALAHFESTTDSSLSGFDNVLEWFRHSKSGYALRSLIKSLASKEADALRRYFQNLSFSIKPDERQKTTINPILLNVGAVAQGETETVPIYLTNFNPVPIIVSIDVGEVEGSSIELGVDDSFRTLESPSWFDLLDRLRPNTTGQASVGRFKGQSIEAIRSFLREDKVAAKFFERFPFRHDVTTSENAIKTYGAVRRQFQEYATATYSRSSRSSRFSNDGWNACNSTSQPAEYGPFQRKLKFEANNGPGPIMISSDRKMQRELNVCWFSEGESKDKQSDRRRIGIPPMGKARFDVTIRAPSSSVLEKDITSFLSTGLSLSTNHGEVIPILTSFEALRGKLEVSHIPSINVPKSEFMDRTIHVPAGLFGVASKSDSEFVRIPPHHAHSLSQLRSGAKIVPRNVSTVESGVSLYVKSSFHRDIQLREVSSCNPWFQVSLTNQSSSTKNDPLLGIYIGAVSNIVECEGTGGLPANTTQYPSFYRCALSWITKRLTLQPKGCGSSDSRDGRRSSIDSARENDLVELVTSVKRALLVTEWLDSFSRDFVDHANVSNHSVGTSPSTGGLVGPLLAKTIFLARKELTRASDSGMLSLGTALRAVVQYNSTPDESAPISQRSPGAASETSRLVSLAIQNLTISSFLEIPSLLSATDSSGRHVVSFPPTHVFDTSSLMVPLRNPTAVPVRVRVGIAPYFSTETDQSVIGNWLERPYVHGHNSLVKPQDFASLQWWEKAGSYYFPDQTGDIIRSHHNLTLKYGTGARIVMVNPSFSATSAFLIGCGARCGLKQQPKDNKRKEVTVDLTPSSPIGASAAGGVLLRGYHGTHSTFKVDHKSHPLHLHAGGSLYTNLQGPANFAFSRTALDEIVIPPFSEAKLGPLLFRPSGRTPRIGCGAIRGNRKVKDCSSQLFETTVYLENSLSGVESFYLRGKAMWESIIFLDPSEEEFGHIEIRNDEPTILFTGSALESRDYLRPIPEIINVVVYNDGDTNVRVSSGGFAGVGSSALCAAGTFKFLDCSETFPFVLQPKENRTLSIGQFATCAKLREYHRFVLNYERHESSEENSHFPRDSSFYMKRDKFRQSEKIKKNQIDIQVGYEMQSAALATCINNFGFPLESKNEKANGRSKRVWRRRFPLLRVVILVSCILLLVDKLLNTWVRVIMSNVALERFVINVGDTYIQNTAWTDSYMMLSSKTDIPVAELEALSIERNTTILQSTSKRLGVVAPQARSYSLAKNNTVTIKPPTANASDRRGSSKSDRVRASEGIFGRFNPEIDVSPGRLPVNVGWRIAASRGYINTESFAKVSIDLNTTKLIESRRIASESNIDNSNGNDNLDDSSVATSYGEISLGEEDAYKLNSKRIVHNDGDKGNKSPLEYPEPVSPSSSESGWVDARAKPSKVPQHDSRSVVNSAMTKKKKTNVTKGNNGKTKEKRTPKPEAGNPSTPPPKKTAPVVEPDPFPDTLSLTEDEAEPIDLPTPSTALRPPPGLAPPPGFGSAPFSLPTQPSPPQLGGDSPQLLPSITSELIPTLSLDNTNITSSALPQSALEGIIPGLHSATPPENEYDFNVMDFLDGLLEESQQTSGVPSNPWAAGNLDETLFGGADESNPNDTMPY